jgi:PBSX family phage portal protein
LNENHVGVRVVKADSGQKASNTIADPFEDLYETNGLIEPPYDPASLVKMPESSNILQPLIDAYKTNIVGFGHSFKYNIDMESQDIDQAMKDRAKKEWTALDLMYKYCNFDQTFTEINKKMLDDRERIGWGIIEVIPRGNGLPGSFEPLPAHTFRLSKVHPDIQQVPVMAVGIDGKQVKITFAKRFRRFCQKLDRTNEYIWFKEFGDPRRMDKKTGKFETEMGPDGKPVKTQILPENEATSVMYFPIAASYTPYGIPRWIGNVLSIYGSRRAEELNYAYFSKGKHIPMAILVKNGMLTKSSIDELQKYANQVNGIENAYGYLIIEAEGFDSGDGLDEKQGPPVDIKLQPLTQVMQQDGLFQNYDGGNRDKLRASFRLPPIYTGESKDYTRATADTARGIAEEQIFNPEREELAAKYNRLINTPLGIRYVELYFKGPNLTNKVELAQAVDIYAKAGALTPNMLVGAVSELLGLEFEPIQEAWGNVPMPLCIEFIRAGVTIPEKGGKIETPTDPNATNTDNSTGPSFTDNSAGQAIKG